MEHYHSCNICFFRSQTEDTCTVFFSEYQSTKQVFQNIHPEESFIWNIFKILKSWFYTLLKQETNALCYPYIHFQLTFIRLTHKILCKWLQWIDCNMRIKWFCSYDFGGKKNLQTKNKQTGKINEKSKWKKKKKQPNTLAPQTANNKHFCKTSAFHERNKSSKESSILWTNCLL